MVKLYFHIILLRKALFVHMDARECFAVCYSDLTTMQLNVGESVKVVNPVGSKISNMIRTENDSAVPVVKSEPVDPVITLPISSSFSCQVKAGSQSFLVC